MYRVRFLTVGLLTVLGLFFCTAAFGGVVILSEGKQYRSSRKQKTMETKTKTYIGEKGVRTENFVMNKDAPSMSMVYRYNSGDDFLLILHHRGKFYQKMDREDLEEMEKKAEETRGKMEGAMKDAPPEVRKRYEKQMGKKGKQEESEQKVELKKVETDVKVGDWSCDKYEGYRDGDKISEVWVTEVAGLSEDDYEMLSNMMDFMEKMNEVSRSFQKGKGDKPINQGRFLKKGVYPVKWINYSNGKKTNESRLKKLEEKDISSSRFEVPKGYEKRENQFQKR
ncbi:MAG: hypothetical protein R6V10_10725 [bacterium]